ncbi:MAG: type III toxin-antitoxin system ToxN/AbiQ family toxin [Oscillospiraceae bacterium]|nr:type III toxin-antitoxin system ToxN/AbiQ family toxin [Oscillospiraceae bacterium]
MDINFYNVDLKYIEFFKKYETEHRGFTRVPNVNYHSGNNKFFYGTVLNVNDINYFVPVSSKIHSKQDDLLIRAKNRPNLIYGTLRFAYMLPIPKECLSLLIRDELNDHQKSLRIKNELAFCRRNKDKIVRQAVRTYERIVSNKNDMLTHNSCDFRLLEQAYIEYCTINRLECPQTAK